MESGMTEIMDAVEAALPIMVSTVGGIIGITVIFNIFVRIIKPIMEDRLAERDEQMARDKEVQSQINSNSPGTILNGETVQEKKLPKWRKVF